MHTWYVLMYFFSEVLQPFKEQRLASFRVICSLSFVEILCCSVQIVQLYLSVSLFLPLVSSPGAQSIHNIDVPWQIGENFACVLVLSAIMQPSLSFSLSFVSNYPSLWLLHATGHCTCWIWLFAAIYSMYTWQIHVKFVLNHGMAPQYDFYIYNIQLLRVKCNCIWAPTSVTNHKPIPKEFLRYPLGDCRWDF